jgi:hypothetical protein
MRSRTIHIDHLTDLRANEPAILSAIARAPWGPQRFLADPTRFLREEDFAVSDTLAESLRRAHVAPPTLPAAAYEEIRAGRHPWCRSTVAITNLAIPEKVTP